MYHSKHELKLVSMTVCLIASQSALAFYTTRSSMETAVRLNRLLPYRANTGFDYYSTRCIKTSDSAIASYVLAVTSDLNHGRPLYSTKFLCLKS